MKKFDNFKDNGGSFLWFTGVVEDIKDPEEMGRVKVRIFGYHTDSKANISTDDLPWATVMLPVTSASITSVGQSPTGLLQGSWVVGFFRDGSNAQDPFIMGSVTSMSTLPANPSKGFSDPDGEYPRAALLNKPDNPIPARKDYKDSRVYKVKDALKQEEIETASAPEMEVGTIGGGTGSPWNSIDPSATVSPAYPKNHVVETESGHVIEHDDTPGSERISVFHTSGTHEETVASGDKEVFIVGNGYTIVLKDNNILIRGNLNTTVEGDMRTLVKGNYVLEVEGDKAEYIKGSRGSKVGGNELLEVDQDQASNIGENRNALINKDDNLIIKGNYDCNIGEDSDTIVQGDLTFITFGGEIKTVLESWNVSIGNSLTIATSGVLSIESQDEIGLISDADITIEGLTINLN